MKNVEKKNRVVGVIGVKAEMANWNAGFDGDPKCTYDGTIFGSDKALKHAMRQQWLDTGLKVLMMKSRKVKDGKILPKTLEERYNEYFGPIDTKKTLIVLENLFDTIDCLNFGVAFAVKQVNHSITGAVQINQGLNKYSDTEVIVQDILSPFANSNGDGKSQTTIGKMTHVDEAHYCYGFSVNPFVYNSYKELFGKEFNGYTEEAYEYFKKAALTSVTELNTASKCGCSNEYGIFINLKDESKVMLPNFSNFITIEKEEKVIVNMNKAKNILEAYKDHIDSIEIYLDDQLTTIDYSELTDDIKNLIVENSIYSCI